jgi:hypothetical protein
MPILNGYEACKKIVNYYDAEREAFKVKKS